jgi:hypothetical protein
MTPREELEYLRSLKAKMDDGGQPVSGKALGTARSFTEGLTFGWGDEIGTGLAALAVKATGDDKPIGQIYDEMMDSYEREQGDFRRRHPVLSTTAEIGGGLTTGLVGGSRLLATKGAQKLSQLPRFVKYPGAGAVTGGITGAGMAPQGEKLQGATFGAVTGAVIGGGVPLAVAGVKSGVKAAQAPVSAAARKIKEAMVRDGLTPERLSAKLNQLGPDASLVDAGGENMLGLARAVQSEPGKAKNIAMRTLTQRARNQSKRINERLSPLNNKGNFYDEMDDLIAKRKADAQPLYERAVNKNNLVPEDKFSSVMDDEWLSGVIKKVKSDKLAGMSELPDNSMPVIDAAKKKIDDMIGVARRSGQTNKVRLLEGKKEQLVKIADDSFPDYKAARQAFETPSKAMDAMEDGVNFIKNPSGITRRQISAMSDADKEFFRAGAYRAILNKIESAPDSADIVKRIFGNQAMRDKIKAVFPDEKSFREFQKAMLAEGKMYQTKNAVLGNSATARIQAEQADLAKDSLTGAAIDVAQGNTGQAATGLFRRMLNSKGGVNPDQSSKMASMLFDPKSKGDALKLIQQRGLLDVDAMLPTIGASAPTGLLMGR